MNLSGEAVQAILTFYKLTSEDIIVIHDDLDIAVGNYKISKNVSSAGHNGIDSIIENIGTQDFTRIRIGVEMEAGRQARQIPGEDFVLQKFTEEELEKIKKISDDILNEIKKLL
jgi:PTH1 family peptidyl-tRNA hydrolase